MESSLKQAQWQIRNKRRKKIRRKRREKNFHGPPVGKTPCFQCRGPGFDPWSGNYIPQMATKNRHAIPKIKDPACYN